MNGQEVFKFAVRKVPELILELTGGGRDQAGRDRSYCVASGESKDYRSCCQKIEPERFKISGEFGQICKYFGSFDPCFVG